MNVDNKVVIRLKWDLKKCFKKTVNISGKIFSLPNRMVRADCDFKIICSKMTEFQWDSEVSVWIPTSSYALGIKYCMFIMPSLPPEYILFHRPPPQIFVLFKCCATVKTPPGSSL